jgi:hypothetical protein
VTDATPDPLTDATTPAPDEGPEFVVTPTLRAFGELVARVEHLEADSPALPAEGDDDAAEDAATDARLARHRAEIEAVKTTLNALIEYLTVPGANLPAAIPPAPVATPAAADPTSGVTP